MRDGYDAKTMGQKHRVVWAALLVLGVFAVGCNDEKKPPLTPDGPDMTVPDGGAGGDVPVAPGTGTPPAK
jgi:hypothetical protein